MLGKLKSLYYRLSFTPENYARHIGVKLGKDCLIDTRNWSSEPHLITIGNNVQLTKDVTIHTHGGANAVRERQKDFDAFGKVVIEDWAYIGAHSQIMLGITIGRGALLAAGLVVTKSVAPGSVVGGNPAQYICTIDEYIERNKKYNLGTNGLSKDQKRHVLFNTPDVKFLKK